MFFSYNADCFCAVPQEKRMADKKTDADSRIIFTDSFMD